MTNKLILIFTLAALLSFAAAPAAGAAPNWTTMHEDQNAVHQVDSERIAFSGDAADRQLEFWMKSVFKNGTGWMVARYQVKEKGLVYIMKERTFYSPTGQATDSFVNKTDKWLTTTATTPIGAVATRLFADYAQNPDAFPAPAADAGQQPGDQPAAAPTAVKFAPQEIKQALDDNRIKQEDKDGSKAYRVRDTYTVYYGLSNHRMTADFYLFTYPGGARPQKHLNIALSDTRTGTHSTKPTVTVGIDGTEWQLRALSTSPGASGSSTVSFQYYYDLPEPLVQALLATKNGVTLKWQYMYGSWKTLEYTVPAKIVRDIQMMYAGCK